MKMLKHVFLLTCFSIILTGCATPFPVNPNMPEARIANNNYKIFQNNNLSLIFADYKNCSSDKPAAILPFEAAMPFNVKNPATIFVMHTVGYTKFYIAATFQPQANHTYLVDTKSSKVSGLKIKVTLRVLDHTNGDQPTLIAERKSEMGYFSMKACSSADYATSMANKKSKIEQQGYILPPYLLTEKFDN